MHKRIIILGSTGSIGQAALQVVTALGDEVLLALRDAPDSEFVTIRSREDSVRVAKEDGFLLVNVDEADGDRVRVRVPMEVVDVLLEAMSLFLSEGKYYLKTML